MKRQDGSSSVSFIRDVLEKVTEACEHEGNRIDQRSVMLHVMANLTHLTWSDRRIDLVNMAEKEHGPRKS